jgi:hypothetical protein
LFFAPLALPLRKGEQTIRPAIRCAALDICFTEILVLKSWWDVPTHKPSLRRVSLKENKVRIDPGFCLRAIRAAGPVGIALISFCAGMLFHAYVNRPERVEAASDHVFELMIYHTLPGKVPALESVFHDVSALQAKHGLNAVGYWVPTGNDPAWENTFVYLVVHPSRQAAEANWDALHADPAFQPYFKAAAPLIQHADGNYKVDEVYMRPTNYSAMK